MITWLGPGRIYMDYGPIQATLSAWQGTRPMEEELPLAAEYGGKCLGELSAFLAVAKLPPERIRNLAALPGILREMVLTVRSCQDPSLTPMAAVAGTFADTMADFLVDRGATKVMVSNGGDIALRLLPGETTRVGIVSDIAAGAYSHVLDVTSSDGIGGICTSGFGGRSFTKGIASAVVTLARNCRSADAAATLIANHTTAPDPGIHMVRAETIDPETDIPNHLVTAAIGELAPETWSNAVLNGAAKAQEFMKMQVISGAAIFAGDRMTMLPERLAGKIRLAEQHQP